jgi:hypothetical protein
MSQIQWIMPTQEWASNSSTEDCKDVFGNVYGVWEIISLMWFLIFPILGEISHLVCVSLRLGFTARDQVLFYCSILQFLMTTVYYTMLYRCSGYLMMIRWIQTNFILFWYYHPLLNEPKIRLYNYFYPKIGDSNLINFLLQLIHTLSLVYKITVFCVVLITIVAVLLTTWPMQTVESVSYYSQIIDYYYYAVQFKVADIKNEST